MKFGIVRMGGTLLRLLETKIVRYMPYVRPMITFISRNYQQKDLVGVEIGVAAGDNALFILRTLPIKKLYLVDPYITYEEAGDNVGGKYNIQSTFDNVLKVARKRLGKFGDKVEFIRKKSEDATDDIPDDLDFVYIDGNHDYEYVKKDLELYYPKVKMGGVFGGDNFESLYPSVCRAVIEFADKRGLRIHGARSRASYEWWVIKK